MKDLQIYALLNRDEVEHLTNVLDQAIIQEQELPDGFDQEDIDHANGMVNMYEGIKTKLGL